MKLKLKFVFLQANNNLKHFDVDIFDRLDDFSDTAVRYIDEHSGWFYGIGSGIIYVIMAVSVTISEGFNFPFMVLLIFIAFMIGWPMMLIYILPFGLIQLLCYCIKHPKEALFTTIEVIGSIIVLGFLLLYLEALLSGGY